MTSHGMLSIHVWAPRSSGSESPLFPFQHCPVTDVAMEKGGGSPSWATNPLALTKAQASLLRKLGAPLLLLLDMKMLVTFPRLWGWQMLINVSADNRFDFFSS